MATPDVRSRDDERWQPAAERPEHPLAAIDGALLGDGVSLEVRLGPRSSVGSTYFRCYLDGPDGRTSAPVVFGLQNSGPYPGFNWVEVLDYTDELPLSNGAPLAVSAEVERALFERLASLVPAGGHLMAEYDSKARASTARALSAGVPPVATPLGALLFDVGCGVAFWDWYISEGGREGPRKLQGFRAADEAHARSRGVQALDALDAFLANAARLPDDLRSEVTPLADRIRTRLREEYGSTSSETGAQGNHNTVV